MSAIHYYKFKASLIILHTVFKTNIVKSELEKNAKSPQIIGHYNHVSKRTMHYMLLERCKRGAFM